MKWLSRAIALALSALLAVALSAHAHPESAAPELHPQVVEVGHRPASPAPGTQWTGFIAFSPGHDVKAVGYQICRVANACFAPETPAARDGDTFTFDTADYGDQPVRWGVGDGDDWHVGYKFILHDTDANASKFPQGLRVGTPECEELGIFECDATNYFVFTIAGVEEGRGAAGPFVLLPLLLALEGLRRRRGNGARPGWAALSWPPRAQRSSVRRATGCSAGRTTRSSWRRASETLARRTVGSSAQHTTGSWTRRRS